MNEFDAAEMEELVRKQAAGFEYPPTPDVAARVGERLAAQRPAARPSLRWEAAAVMLLLACLAVLAAVPPARAALLRMLQIGAMEINLQEEPLLDAAAVREPQPVSIADLGEEISMERAGELVSLRDPAVPLSLGEPDFIYGQNLLYREPVVSFLWLATEERPQLLLTQIEVPSFGVKWAISEQALETAVNGRAAFWIEGPHLFSLDDMSLEQQRVIGSNVLIWAEGETTFRLEGELALDEAVRIAESW